MGGSSIEASKIAGHASTKITEEYTVVQFKRQEELTRRIQEKLTKAAEHSDGTPARQGSEIPPAIQANGADKTPLAASLMPHSAARSDPRRRSHFRLFGKTPRCSYPAVLQGITSRQEILTGQQCTTVNARQEYRLQMRSSNSKIEDAS